MNIGDTSTSRQWPLVLQLLRLYEGPVNFPRESVLLRGTIPTDECVADVGLYFPFQNLDRDLAELVYCINYLLKEMAEGSGFDRHHRVYFTNCAGIAGIGKTCVLTEGIPQYLARVAQKQVKVNKVTVKQQYTYFLTLLVVSLSIL